jgi:oxygen-independent coproporphyrinogen-3 oxidase
VYDFIDYVAGKFQSLSVDLIVGLPGMKLSDWIDTIKQVVLLPIHHVSLYFLTLHPETKLAYQTQKNIPTEDETVSWYLWAADELEAAGFMQYEISNFARLGHESVHNKVYWQRKPYYGCGLGAHSFDGNATRTSNTPRLMDYCEHVAQGKSVQDYGEHLDAEQINLECIMLALRQVTGIQYDSLYALPGKDRNALMAYLKELVTEQLASEKGNFFILTRRGMILADEIVARMGNVASVVNHKE